uniref:Exoribonuclease phosphorolytic domain-containing protein n=1 Tax=Paramoeba aestuarina TaxID=180227 RepID=A0A7S4UJY0_9EUKA|mmetsp:Transcript_8459/g.12788  ORF Transcript_8459/g.12788 Transcript_8459/m.12788 type:complete len:278 (+) Transcript_8459:39-872(+)
MDTDTVVEVHKEAYGKSSEVNFAPLFNGGAAVLLGNSESKVHVSFHGPFHDRYQARQDCASIAVTITHDAGHPQAGASGRLTKAIQKSHLRHEDTLLGERIEHVLESVVQHSAYPRCTLSFCVHVLQKGENLIATALCACMMCLLSAGVRCSTTLVPHTVALVRRRVDEIEHLDVSIGLQEGQMPRLFADPSVVQSTRATIVHDISGRQLLTLIFESNTVSHEHSKRLGPSESNSKDDSETLAIMERVARGEITGFVHWLKAIFSDRIVLSPYSCVP